MGPSFSQVLALGVRDWSRDRGAAGAHSQPVHSAPACCWKKLFPLLEGGADPSPSAWASGQLGGERGRRWLLLGLGVGKGSSGCCGSPRASRFDGITGDRRLMEKFYKETVYVRD